MANITAELRATRVNRFASAMQRVKTSVAGIGPVANRTNISLKNLGRSFAQVAAVVGAAALSKQLIKSAGDFEQVKIQFETLTGSMQKSRAVLDELLRYSAKTPFQFEDLTKATGTLLGFGLGVKESIILTRQLGDISAATGANLQQISINTGQIIGRNKADLIDLKQYVNQQLPIFKLLEETTGKSQKQLRELSRQGKITGDLIAQSFAIATSEGGKFFQATEKQSKTLNGLFSTLRDKFSLVSIELGNKMLPSLKRVTQGALRFGDQLLLALNNFNTFISGFSGSTQLAVLKVYRVFSDIPKEFSKLFQELKKTFVNDSVKLVIIKFFEAIGQAVRFAVKSIRAFIIGTRGLGKIVQSILENGLSFFTGAQITAITTGSLAEIIAVFDEKLPGIPEGKGANGFKDAFGELGTSAAQNAVESMKRVFSVKGFTSLNDQIQQFFNDREAIEGIRKALNPSAPERVGLVNLVNNDSQFKKAAQQFKGFGENLRTTFQSSIQPALFGIANGFSEMANAVGAGGKKLTDDFKQFLATLLADVPKLVGFGLIQKGVALPGPAGLGLILAGVGLVGLGGLIGGLLTDRPEDKSGGLQFSSSVVGANSGFGLSSLNPNQDFSPTIILYNTIEADGITQIVSRQILRGEERRNG